MAHAVSAVVHPPKSKPDGAQHIGFTIESPDRQLPVEGTLGLVGRIGEVPAPLRARRAAAAEESAKRWRAAVSKLLRQQKYKLLDALSDPDHHE